VGRDGDQRASGHGPGAGWRAPGEMYHDVIYFRRFWQSGFLMSSKNARPTGASRSGDFATNSRLILLSAFALVIDDPVSRNIVGIVSRSDLVKPARALHDEDVHRERVFSFRAR
jgi:hypothetical protein